jgi:small subunit ribosomal protein S5
MEKGKYKSRRFKSQKPKPEFEQKILDIARVTRVMAGGRRFSFRIAAVIGDKKGRVGIGVAKGSDVSLAMEKAVNDAKKNMITVNIIDGSIPHEIQVKNKGSKILLKPARAGRGVIAGGAVRVVCEFAGISNITAKMLSKSKNKINNARATINALKQLRVKKEAVKKDNVKSENTISNENKEKKSEENIKAKA